VVSDKGNQHLLQGMVADHVVGADAITIRGRSRRRHSRKRRNPPRDDERRDHVQPRLPYQAYASPGLFPPCLLGWNHAMTVVEEDLRKVVVVSTCKNCTHGYKYV
jgi:hypothetical protein